MGAGATREAVCRREPPDRESDNLHERIRDGARRFKRPHGHPLAAFVVGRGLPSGVWTSRSRRAAIDRRSPTFSPFCAALERRHPPLAFHGQEDDRDLGLGSTRRGSRSQTSANRSDRDLGRPQWLLSASAGRILFGMPRDSSPQPFDMAVGMDLRRSRSSPCKSCLLRLLLRTADRAAGSPWVCRGRSQCR